MLARLGVAGRRIQAGRCWRDRAQLTAHSSIRRFATAAEQKPKERPPGTYTIWAMEAIGAMMAFLYYLHLHTDLLKPEVKERLDPQKYTPFTLIEKEPLTPATLLASASA
ncbi:hypothetical protein IWW38_003915 [Coemansia aciculifera]|uniref:Uncharacterized protein n=1 Tax=Coemansia aciculifera TaxID=417176 RepID=A0ACC1LZE8_9FUNG|nr:hypothetical protein IWW38_003915 [Coemansia aciculifera]